jgi:hypothetical protein
VVIGYARDRTVIASGAHLAREREIGARLVGGVLPSGELLLATAAGDVELVAPDTGAVTVLGHHGHPVTATAMSRSLVATGDSAGQIYIFDRASHARVRAVVAAEAASITALALDPEEQRAIAGYATGVVRTYPLQLPAAIERACATLAAFGRTCQRP